MSSLSPQTHDPYGHNTGNYAADESADSGKSPLAMSLSFLKGLTEKKNTRGRAHISVRSHEFIL
jgi:hypothetical protein